MKMHGPGEPLFVRLVLLLLFGFCWLIGYIWGDYSGRRTMLKECMTYKKSVQSPAKQGLQSWSQYSANRWPQ